MEEVNQSSGFFVWSPPGVGGSVYTCLDWCLRQEDGAGRGRGGPGERAGEHRGLGSPVGLCRTTKRKGLSMMISSGAIRAETMMAKREGTRF